MIALSAKTCEACKAGVPPVSDADLSKLSAEVPDWDVIEIGGIKRLTRAFRFPDFAAALTFTNKVGSLAEEENHHPAIVTEWGRVSVSWWTHKIGGLHLNDFIMAAKTDTLLNS